MDCSSLEHRRAVFKSFFIGYTKGKTSQANCTNPVSGISRAKLVATWFEDISIAVCKSFHPSQLWQMFTGSKSEIRASEEDKSWRYPRFSVSAVLFFSGLSNELKSNGGEEGPRVHTHWCTHACAAGCQPTSCWRCRLQTAHSAPVSFRSTAYFTLQTCFLALAVDFSVAK